MKPDPTTYVCGFAFDENTERVALIRKNKPAWQAGLLNGIGGKVEKGESFGAAMAREFYEEAGMITLPSMWRPLLTLQDGSQKYIGGNWEVHFHIAYGLDLNQVKTMTDEVINVLSWQAVSTSYNPRQEYYACVPNLHWLLPLAAQREINGGSLIDMSGVEG